MRYSYQRETVNELLRNCKDHPTAETLYERAKEVVPNISLATVYRNLRTLAENGELLTLETVDKKIHYDGDISPHSHFLCTGCGKIIDIFVQPTTPTLLKEMGLSVESEKTFYYGHCAECGRAE